jgi:ribonuclease E
MARKIYMNVAEGDECRIAVIEDGRLYEFFIDRPSQLKHVGNIYKGIVNNIEPGIQAAFVDVGLERNGFLHVSDVSYSYQDNPDIKSLFARTLRIKEPLAEETVLQKREERDVEQVDEFVGDGTHHAEARNGAHEADFLEKLEEEHPGHPVTESPLVVTQNVAPAGAETASPISISTSGSTPPVGESAAPVAEAPISQPAQPAAADGTSSVMPASGQPPAQGGPNGDRKRRRRRRRRGGRDRREFPGAPATANPAAVTPGHTPAEPPTTAPQAQTADLFAPREEPPRAVDAAPSEPVPAPEPAVNGTAAPAAPAEATVPATPKKRRVRTPKKRGGHLPKRVLEAGAIEPAGEDTATKKPSGDSRPDDNTDRNGSGGDGGPIPGPMYRYHRPPLPKLQNLLRRSQEVVVQVTKASQGGKGPGLSTFVSLPGRYMVLTPNSNRGGVSRKIEDGGARNELRDMLERLPVPEGMGVIVRTAAINRTFEDLQRDLNYLVRVWSVISERIHDSEAPALLYTDSDPAIRAVRDYFTADTMEIVIDDKIVFDRVLAFFDQLMPSFRDRVKLYESEVPLFFSAGLENEIEHLFDKKVTLKSGGYLYVEQTEALISIDVNSGKFTSAGDAERTAYQTNMEAIPEICRQLRLRDLGGIVCCDLIDMESAKHRSDVEHALKRELRRDRARTKVARMSPFGVIEMTRQRVRPSIKNYTYVMCPTCQGFGMVRSAETMCLSLLRRMKVALIEERVFELAVQIHPHVLSHLHSEFRDDIDDIEEKTGKNIVFEYAKDLSLGQTRFFYVNDRGVRVLYDMDQRINSFAGSGPKAKTNVPLPPIATGAGTAPTPAFGDRKSRRRRGGRRQREREQERQHRDERIKSDSSKAVTFGDTLPEARIEVIKQEPAAAPVPGARPGEPGKGRRRGRRGGRRQREREGAPNRGPDTGRPSQGEAAPTPSPGVQGGEPQAMERPQAPAPAPVATPEPAKQPEPAAGGGKGRRPAAKKPAKARPAKTGDARKKAAAKKPAVKRKPAARKTAPKKKA